MTLRIYEDTTEMKKDPNCIGIIRKKDGALKYYWCKLQFWKYSSMRLAGSEDGALSYPAYDPNILIRLNEEEKE